MLEQEVPSEKSVALGAYEGDIAAAHGLAIPPFDGAKADAPSRGCLNERTGCLNHRGMERSVGPVIFIPNGQTACRRWVSFHVVKVCFGTTPPAITAQKLHGDVTRHILNCFVRKADAPGEQALDEISEGKGTREAPPITLQYDRCVRSFGLKGEHRQGLVARHEVAVHDGTLATPRRAQEPAAADAGTRVALLSGARLLK